MTKDRSAPTAPSGEGGFALVAVLLVLALIGILGAEFAYSMRLEARAALTYKEGIIGTHLAEAAVQSALRELVGQGTLVAPGEDGLLTFYTAAGIAVPRLPRDKVEAPGGHYSYRITDESARINLNAGQPARVERLLQALKVDKSERDVISASLQDWRDRNDTFRLSGAESDDYYLKLPVPHRARNANLASINELLQIKGVTPDLFRGTAERPGLAELVTVAPAATQVNINTASALVLEALELSEAEIGEILSRRQVAPYTAASRFSGRGLGYLPRAFRIEAEGLIDGRVRARLTVVVQPGTDAANPSLRILDWAAGR
jgi:general secretion pathway protein K